MNATQFIAEHGWDRKFLFILPEHSIMNMTFSYDICDRLIGYGMSVERVSANYIKLSDINTEIHIRTLTQVGYFIPDMIFVHCIIEDKDIARMKQLYPNATIKKFSY